MCARQMECYAAALATVPVRVSADETFDVGEDTDTPINRDYDVPFEFTGELQKVVVELKPAKP